jgi:hypothetical protein
VSTLRSALPLERPGRSRPRLTVVPPPRTRPARTPFVLLLLGLLLGGMVSLLLLNTALAEGSFVVQELQERATELADDEATLAQEVAAAESPAELAARAEELGMVPTSNPAFLRLSDGAILGTPQVGEAPAPPEPPPADPAAAPADQAPADQAPADQAPADQAPADQAPADQAPAQPPTPADPAAEPADVPVDPADTPPPADPAPPVDPAAAAATAQPGEG